MRASPILAILAQQLWQGGAGLVTVLCIALFLTPDQQGWYYTLVSLAALSSLMEFGLSAVLLHSGARLFTAASWQNGYVIGRNAAAYESLAGWALAYFVRCAAIFLALMVPIGLSVFSQAGRSLAEWLPLFIGLMVITAVALLPQPLLFLIEGSGRVEAVYRLRLAQGIVGAVGGWLMMATGFGLAATLCAPLAACVVPLAWLYMHYARLMTGVLRQARHPPRLWSTLWPQQARIGMGLLSAYLLTQLMTPILFAAQGPLQAGQFGLSLTICTMLSLMARSHFIGHLPALTQTAHRREWARFDAMIRQDFLWFAALFAAGCILSLGLVYAARFTLLADRILPLSLFLGLLMCVGANACQTMLASQLRTLDREPLTYLNFTSAALTLIGAFWSAPHYGVKGVVIVMLLIQCVCSLPLSFFIWHRCLRIERDAKTTSDNCNSDL